MKVKQHKTLCGIRPRAYVVSHEGPKFLFRFPCGYEMAEVQTVGPRGAKKPMGEYAANFYASWWRKGQGVSMECPRCRRAALRAERGGK